MLKTEPALPDWLTDLSLTWVGGDAAWVDGPLQLPQAVEDKGQALPLNAQPVRLVVPWKFKSVQKVEVYKNAATHAH